jgi:sarcosine oxidase gamma subunit
VTEHWDGTHPEEWAANEAEWQVLIEEAVTAERHWRLTGTHPAGDEEEARQLAFELARTYEPQHPMSPQGRRVYEVGPDAWVVQVPGATVDFHFRVSVARLVTVLDRKGRVEVEF